MGDPLPAGLWEENRCRLHTSAASARGGVSVSIKTSSLNSPTSAGPLGPSFPCLAPPPPWEVQPDLQPQVPTFLEEGFLEDRGGARNVRKAHSCYLLPVCWMLFLLPCLPCWGGTVAASLCIFFHINDSRTSVHFIISVVSLFSPKKL